MYLTKGEKEYIKDLDPKDPHFEQRKKLLLDDYRESEKIKHREIVDGIRQLLIKDPSMLDNLNNILKYRELRVEQCLIAEWIQEARENTGEGWFKIDKMQERSQTLDKERRACHNKALAGFYRIVEAQKNKNIVNVAYSGDIMNPFDEQDNYGMHTVREKMTDAFLDTLYAIESSNASELDDRDKTFAEFRKSSISSERGWNATIREDDGDLIQ